jgi:predicted nucleotidyltransferase
MNLIDKNVEAIIKLCEKHTVKELYLFGSVLTDRFNDSSDVDLLVQFGDLEINSYLDNYMNFKEELERILSRPVDIIENQAIRNPIFRRILDRDKVLIYERKSA